MQGLTVVIYQTDLLYTFVLTGLQGYTLDFIIVIGRLGKCAPNIHYQLLPQFFNPTSWKYKICSSIYNIVVHLTLRGLLVAALRKLLNKGFIVVKLKSSLKILWSPP